MCSCHSEVGYRHNQHVIVTISSGFCIKTGSVMHELLHALGFHHEHTRPDRDNFVTIHFDNIIPGACIFIMFKLLSRFTINIT